jgi:hypothetical protein
MNNKGGFMKNVITIILASMVMMACGSSPEGYTTAAEEQKKQQEKDAANVGLSSPTDYLEVSGYVTPINISVDGKTYRDSEDFYTQELRKLQAQVKKDYAGYTLSFDAQVGLKNFKTGMYVLLAATADVGVASETYVDGQGKFTFMVDGKTDRNVDYTLRAVKRISLQLTKKGSETISWCYNMYAEKNVMLDGKSQILRSFVTSVTEYQCEQTDGINVPEAEMSEMDQEWMDRAKKEQKRDAAVNAAKDEEEILVDEATSSENENEASNNKKTK